MAKVKQLIYRLVFDPQKDICCFWLQLLSKCLPRFIVAWERSINWFSCQKRSVNWFLNSYWCTRTYILLFSFICFGNVCQDFLCELIQHVLFNALPFFLFAGWVFWPLQGMLLHLLCCIFCHNKLVHALACLREFQRDFTFNCTKV